MRPETTFDLIKEAQRLVDQLDEAKDAYYIEHSHLGWIVNKQIDNPLRRMRIRRLRTLAQRRLVRRQVKAGQTPPINRAFAMWVLNSRDSSWF